MEDYLLFAARVLGRWKLLRRRRFLALLAGFLVCYSTISIVLYNQHHPALNGHGTNTLQETHQHGVGQADEFSACLLVMDDNHYLIEWLAYHYHALNLRTLIVMTDPASQTSPHPILKRWKNLKLMDIVEWTDRDFMTKEEFQTAQTEVINYFGGTQITPKLIIHRARQRMFYYKCLQTLKQQGKTWTLLTDTDEFVTINYETVHQSMHQSIDLNLTTAAPPRMDQPGAVARFLQNQVKGPQVQELNDNQPLYILQSSPCIQIPRIRYGAQESDTSTTSTSTSTSTTVEENQQQHLVVIPDGYNASHFLTLKYRHHTQADDYKKNKISKTILDLSRISDKDLLPVDSIHLPVRSLCQQRRLHLRKSQSLLVIHHYLGGHDQYTYRENDARLGKERGEDQWLAHNRIQHAETDDGDGIRSWLAGFDRQLPNSAKELLKEVGQLEPKSWKTFYGNPNTERCALCFFGLPRAYRYMVLPSIVRNLLIPNARHNCDVYVHFYQQYEEVAGRKNRGGKVDPTEVFLLEQAVKAVYRKYGPTEGRNVHTPQIAYTYDTEVQFWDKRRATIERYHHTMNADGKPAYYPYGAKTYTNSSLDNIVKQWHSIEYAFKLMDISAKQLGVTYSRVGMFRSDAMYLSPIDIALLDKNVTDSQNRHTVMAPFARMPVNDRMIYGAYEAVKLWSTKRFELLEERAKAQTDPGFIMHSEKFLNASIFPAMEAMGYKSNINRDICFVRTRADESAMVSDCNVGGDTRGWDKVNKKNVVEDLVQHNCTYFKMGFKWRFVGCGEGVEYLDGK
jgi:hypothetical protein